MHVSFHFMYNDLYRFQHMALSLLFILQLAQNLPIHIPIQVMVHKCRIATNMVLDSIGKCRILIDDSELSLVF